MAIVELDPNFKQAALRSAELRLVLEERAGEVARRAAELAPDDPSTSGQDLHTSIVAEVGLTELGLVGRVNALNFKAPWYEKGTSRQAAQPFLAPAAEQLIGRLERAPEID